MKLLQTCPRWTFTQLSIGWNCLSIVNHAPNVGSERIDTPESPCDTRKGSCNVSLSSESRQADCALSRRRFVRLSRFLPRARTRTLSLTGDIHTCELHVVGRPIEILKIYITTNAHSLEEEFLCSHYAMDLVLVLKAAQLVSMPIDRWRTAKRFRKIARTSVNHTQSEATSFARWFPRIDVW